MLKLDETGKPTSHPKCPCGREDALVGVNSFGEKVNVSANMSAEQLADLFAMCPDCGRMVKDPGQESFTSKYLPVWKKIDKNQLSLPFDSKHPLNIKTGAKEYFIFKDGFEPMCPCGRVGWLNACDDFGDVDNYSYNSLISDIYGICPQCGRMVKSEFLPFSNTPYKKQVWKRVDKNQLSLPLKIGREYLKLRYKDGEWPKCPCGRIGYYRVCDEFGGTNNLTTDYPRYSDYCKCPDCGRMAMSNYKGKNKKNPIIKRVNLEQESLPFEKMGGISIPEKVKTASPDFGYSEFNDRDKELETIEWKESDNSEGDNLGFCLDAALPNSKVRYIGSICCREVSPGTIGVRYSDIKPQWKGTGLGQILYDKAIAKAKELGYHNFCSDIIHGHMSEEGKRAWEKRVSERYPVKINDVNGRFEIKLASMELPSFEKAFKWVSGRELGNFDTIGEYLYWPDIEPLCKLEAEKQGKDWTKLSEEEQNEVAYPIGLENLKNRYNIVQNIYNGKFPLSVYRAITVPKSKDPEIITEGFGVFWSWDEHGAYPHCGDETEHNYVFKGRITKDQIDWLATAGHTIANDDEREIVLHKGTKVNVTGWKSMKEVVWDKPENKFKVITASEPYKTRWEKEIESEEYKWLDEAYKRELREPWVEYVPISELMPLREWMWDRDNNRHGTEEFYDLVEDTKRHGIRSPIIVRYFPDTSRAIIIEGNHRLAAAYEAGLTEIPVKVTIASYKQDEYSHATLGGTVIPRTKDYKADYIPPSEIGLSHKTASFDKIALNVERLIKDFGPKLLNAIGTSLTRYSALSYTDALGAITIIKQFDPTPNKEYTAWLVGAVARGKISYNPNVLDRAFKLLEIFDGMKKAKIIPEELRDIGKIKDLNFLEGLMNPYKTAWEEYQGNKNKNAEDSYYNSKQATLVYNDKNIKVVTPHTMEAAQFFGKNTKWCTSGNKNNLFDGYKYNNRTLYIILIKK